MKCNRCDSTARLLDHHIREAAGNASLIEDPITSVFGIIDVLDSYFAELGDAHERANGPQLVDALLRLTGVSRWLLETILSDDLVKLQETGTRGAE